jgi:hypothetical protein
MDTMKLISIPSWAATGDDEPGMREGTAEIPHPIAAAHLPAAAAVCDAATALDTARDMVDPQPTLGKLLVRHVLLPREFLPQIEINSRDYDHSTEMKKNLQVMRISRRWWSQSGDRLLA